MSAAHHDEHAQREHDHEHDHDHDHDHAHHHHPAPNAAAHKASLLALSSLQRLVLVAPLLGLLWLAVWWALGDTL